MEVIESKEEMILRQNRLKIKALLYEGKEDEIEKIGGIKILKRAENRPHHKSLPEDCVWYVFGYDRSYKAAWGEAEKIIAQGEETTQPAAGDYVFYFDSDGNFMHVGISLGGDRVRSKFGIYHVFEHPQKLVPTQYGDVIKFFTNPNIPHSIEGN